MNKHGTTHRTTTPKMAEFEVSNQAAICDAKGVTLLKDSYLDVIMQLPLPGIIIFVHGVNSDGEWYEQAEEGLCQGLNNRLKRRPEHMEFPTPTAGQLTPAKYTAELTDDGFINTDREPDTFLQAAEHFSPVIRFRWGYKANAEELQNFGDSIYLNEEDYWGGGPFANGCTSLPDLWNEGLSSNLFLWLQVQHLNPDNSRQVFSCPHRAYYIVAALRLAKLVESIRKEQADVPITMVCHSQGNMVGMAAAFLGDRMPGRPVANTYVLCNPPYSLVEDNMTENWTQMHMSDQKGRTGRQTRKARIETLKAFFDIIREPASPPQETSEINRWMANTKHQFDAVTDRAKYGLGTPSQTCGRVTLYCNPHDQVISSTAVRGIGWQGMSAQEIADTGGTGVFCQRVFAQGIFVGKEPDERPQVPKKSYHYWLHHYKKPKPGSWDFWTPASPIAKYSLSKGIEASKRAGVILTVGMAPIFIVATWIARTRINELPHKNWYIPLEAPDLPEPFLPRGFRFGRTTAQFDAYCDARGQDRDMARVREPDDPYAGDRPIGDGKGDPERAPTDAGLGNRDTEAQMRYEDHARLRMQARREGRVEKGAKVIHEDKPEQANAQYKAWREKNIKKYLADTVDTNATDHSTTMTNPEHAEKALAYDVAVGVCHISPLIINKIRITADWRLLKGLNKEDSGKEFLEYFNTGLLKNVPTKNWINNFSEANIPEKISDLRQNFPSSRDNNY
ncbi:hypothetical protein IP91_02887 [Pseudoduganella lurida]|uniref:T6SS Tle3 phospholipase effector alpha/beta domain-containing protein n=1 Tax=Pseudoduganella lurida TaxID=1036180 RepID=A0A562R8W6_9BURK|nr:hypothetical protein [Pseudoduganella lurida]TWI65477.1 hypothetical protein IP91_02887 [Pseudoduganella lurida]